MKKPGPLDLFDDVLSLVNTPDPRLEQAYNDKKAKIETIKKQKITLSEQLEEVTREISALEEELKVKKEENRRLEEENRRDEILFKEKEKELTNKKLTHERVNNELKEWKNRKIRAESVFSKNDTQFLEDLEKKVKAYSYMTGVVWDFPICTKNYLQGVIRNPATKRVKAFSLEVGDRPLEEIHQYFWNMIEELSVPK